VDSKRILLPHAKSAILFPCDLPSHNEWLQRVGKQFRAHIQSNHGVRFVSCVKPNFRTHARARFNYAHILHYFYQHFATNFVAASTNFNRGF